MDKKTLLNLAPKITVHKNFQIVDPKKAEKKEILWGGDGRVWRRGGGVKFCTTKAEHYLNTFELNFFTKVTDAWICVQRKFEPWTILEYQKIRMNLTFQLQCPLFYRKLLLWARSIDRIPK